MNIGAPVAAAPALVRPHSEVKQGQKRTLEAKQEGQTAMAASTASGLSFRVYVSRLFFELIADESYSEPVKCMIPCAPFTPCAAAKTRSPKMFTTTINKRAADNAGYRFTLEGLLKSQEHEGYPCTEARPIGMKPDFPGLFPFQRSTVKWMIDAEQGPGINR
eukprot:COSAG02_NODE_768_length_17375_cov_52.865015_15_plen_162_part_00